MPTYSHVCFSRGFLFFSFTSPYIPSELWVGCLGAKGHRSQGYVSYCSCDPVNWDAVAAKPFLDFPERHGTAPLPLEHLLVRGEVSTEEVCSVASRKSTHIPVGCGGLQKPADPLGSAQRWCCRLISLALPQILFGLVFVGRQELRA